MISLVALPALVMHKCSVTEVQLALVDPPSLAYTLSTIVNPSPAVKVEEDWAERRVIVSVTPWTEFIIR